MFCGFKYRTGTAPGTPPVTVSFSSRVIHCMCTSSSQFVYVICASLFVYFYSTLLWLYSFLVVFHQLAAQSLCHSTKSDIADHVFLITFSVCTYRLLVVLLSRSFEGAPTNIFVFLHARHTPHTHTMPILVSTGYYPGAWRF